MISGILGIVCVSLVLIIYLMRYLNYWTIRGIPQGKHRFFLERIPVAELIRSLYNEFPNERFFGTFISIKPTLIIRDPEIIKQITIKYFDHFIDRSIQFSEDFEPLWSRNLLSLNGKKWRHMRATLSPAFSSRKMRSMFSLMSDCAEEFTEYFQEMGNCRIMEGEMKDVFTRITNDVIASCAFGVKCNSLKERENEFYMMGRSIKFIGIWKLFIFSEFLKYPYVSKILRIKLYSDKVSNFFKNLVAGTIKYREKHNIIRPDMLHLLMEARKGCLTHEESNADIQDTGYATVEESEIGKNTKAKKKVLTDEDIAPQALIFFAAAFDAVSTLLCFIAYELAVNTNIQNKLQNEIDEVYKKCGGKLDYDALNKMKYLDMVTSETLRLWSPPAFIDRMCTKTCNIPNTNPDEAPLRIIKGSPVWIPIWGLHHDEKYYKNPLKFDPERFSDENKSNIIPYTYFPFGVGPRSCIGSRFALLETKTVLFYLLSKFEIVPTNKTQIPLKLDNKNNPFLHVEGGLWLGFKPRT